MREHREPSCPECGSIRHLMAQRIAAPEAAVCLDCHQLFVPETRPDPSRQMCNDCAFRPGSPERSDPYKWAEIIEATIVEGLHPFCCHKGLPCALKDQTLHYELPAGGQTAMTPCAGWAAHKLAYEAGTSARKL